MTPVAVDCRFAADNTVRVSRINTTGRWQAVEQGRQWVDHEGRHVLVMVPGQKAQELLLRRDTLSWVIRPAGRTANRII